MAAAPRWKVYTPDGDYEAATKHIEVAAAIVAMLGDGATIRDGHAAKWIVWTQGVDGDAAESYDAVADNAGLAYA